MMKKLKTLITTIVSMYILFGILLFVFQRDFMYFPTAKAAHAFQTELFSVDQETIEVIVLNKGQPHAIIYFGGNGESVVANAPNFNNIYSNHTVYLVNYRGYGGSTGFPTEENLYSDAQHIYDTITKRHKNISVIGRSLGTGVATFLASTRSIHKMILVTPYDSIQNIAQQQYPIYPISLLLKDKYRSSNRIKDIKSATLIILAEHDTIIPPKSSAQLIKAFPPSQVKVKVIQEADHNTISYQGEYYYLLQRFI